MAVSTIEAGVTRVGNGITTAYSFSFEAKNASEIKVSNIVGSALIPVTSGFTVTINPGGNGGNVTFTSPPANGQSFYIFRDTSLTQLVSVSAQQKYDPQVVEDVWDKLTFIVQELKAAVNRAAKLAPGVDPDSLVILIEQSKVDAVQAAADAILASGEAAASAAAAAAAAGAPSVPVILTADSSIGATDEWIINNKSGSALVVTLPSASAVPGRILFFTNRQAQAITSASVNIVPIAGGALTSQILPPAQAMFGTLVSDGTNWLLTQRQLNPSNIGNALLYAADAATARTAIGAAAEGATGTPSYEVITASTTWNRPAGYAANTPVLIEAWGGGGGGAKHATQALNGGGGGGGYNQRLLRYSDLPASLSITIGAGGAAATGTGNGGAGGNTTVGSLLTAFGGGGGAAHDGTNMGGGGGGGGELAVGANATTGGSGGAGGAVGGGTGRPGNGTSSFLTDAQTIFGGGGGGGGSTFSGAAGGRAVYGGGGGGATSGTTTGAAGGASVYGGAGGNGAGTGAAGAGAAPGGGGGAGNTTQNAGAGARGEVRITIFG